MLINSGRVSFTTISYKVPLFQSPSSISNYFSKLPGIKTFPRGLTSLNSPKLYKPLSLTIFPNSSYSQSQFRIFTSSKGYCTQSNETSTGGVVNLLPEKCPISCVTVYDNQAEVVRDVSAELPSGTTEVIITGLSSEISEDSVRIVGVKGTAKILEVSLESSYLRRAVNDFSKENKLKEHIKILRNKIFKLQQEIKRCDKEIDWINRWSSNLVQTPDEKSRMTVDQITEDTFKKTENFLNYYENKLLRLDERKNEIQEKIEKLDKEVSDYSNELILIPTHNERTNQIVVILSTEQQEKVNFQVAYLIKGAHWQASYDARVNTPTKDEEDSILINYFGNIINNTKEDWKNTQLILSTARPSIAGKPPELKTRFITTNPNIMRKKYKQEQIQTAVYEASKMQNTIEATAKNEEEPIKVNVGFASSTFTITRKSTIMADNKSHKVTIQNLKLPSKYSYTIIPKLSSHTYLKASVMNVSDNVTLLSGKLNVFIDNNFVAKSEIPLILPNESLGIFLGVDGAIKCQYRRIKMLKETEGMISKVNKLSVEYLVTITNHKNKKVDIDLFDSLPKSNESTVKVKLIEPEIDNKNIILTTANNVHWKISLSPSEKKELRYSYSIEYPINEDIIIDSV